MSKRGLITIFTAFVFWASALFIVLGNDGSNNTKENDNELINESTIIDIEKEIEYTGLTDNMELLNDNKLIDFKVKLEESRKIVAEMKRLYQEKLANEKRVKEEKRLAAIKAEEERVAEAIAEEAKQVELARVAEEKRLADLEAQRVAKNKEKEEAEKNGTEEVVVSRGDQSNENWIAFEATHYVAFCDTGCTGITRLGWDVSDTIYYNGHRVIAVDPNVIPLGSLVEVRTSYGSFTALAGDTGGAIKGNKIDILVGNVGEARSLGRIAITLRIIK